MASQTKSVRDLGYEHGYEFGDTLGGRRAAWASEVLVAAGFAESELYSAAYEDYAAAGVEGDRDEYAAAHVRGQIARAKEIAG